MGFTHFAKILCGNVFHQLLLQLVVAGGRGSGLATPLDKELEAIVLGHDTLPHGAIRFVRAY